MIELSNANTINIKAKRNKDNKKRERPIRNECPQNDGNRSGKKNQERSRPKGFFFFFSNNYKIQTMLLVSQGLKLFWYLTNRVQRTRFWCIN